MDSRMKEAMLYDKLNGKVKCNLCNHRCTISPDGFGICHVRQNIKGKLYTLNYGRPIAVHVDPIEKKPLFHFLPGTKSLSLGTVGCNFNCQFCQNSDISQLPKEQGKIAGENLPPKEIVRLAKENNCQSISYTYTEPTIFFEYAYDTAKLAKKAGLKNVFVTNGYYTEETLAKMKGLIDAANIDLKTFDEKSHRELIGASVKPILNSIKKTWEAGLWLEITTLIVTEFNDSPNNLKNIARFIASIDKNIPWHISRYYPAYKYTKPSTSLETLEKAYKIGKEAGLRFVYVGNIQGNKLESTYCPKCSEKLIERYGFEVLKNKIKDGKCPKCGEKILIVGTDK
jgi:pyruvate formate lyase activating enzyme